MSPLTQFFVFFFGAVVGSFLNAVLWRLRTKESFIFGRSYCPSCRHNLSALDLVPIVSWLCLGGRCRHCRKPIGSSYILVETAMGLLFLLSTLNLAATGAVAPTFLPKLLLQWYFFAILTVVFVYDLKYLTILPSVTLPATAVAFIANWALGQKISHLALAAAVAGGFFWLQYVLSRGRWIGGGDAYLGLLLGAMLGWPNVLLALFLAYTSGAVISLGLLATRRKTMKSQLPLGTFLSAATAVALIFGDRLFAWYWGLIL